MPDEFQHHFFKLAFRHLSVAHDHARARRQLLNFRGNFVNRFHAVVHEVSLPAALQLVLDGALDKFFIEAGDYGLYRHTIFWRGFDHAHVAQPHHGHVQGARNGRGRQGEHIYLFAHLLEALFVAHPEALLFIHHYQAKIAELQIFGEQAVGSDEHINFAGFHSLHNFFLLL